METETNIVKILNDDNFDENISDGKEGEWIVFFGAPWCPHCQHFAPIYRNFALQANEKHDNLLIGAVNCDTYDNLCDNQGVREYPTVHIYYNGFRYTMGTKRSVDTLNKFTENFEKEHLKKNEIKKYKNDTTAPSGNLSSILLFRKSCTSFRKRK